MLYCYHDHHYQQQQKQHLIVTSIYSVENCVWLSTTLNDWVSGQTEICGRTAQSKISIDSFHPIRILGEGSFGRVVLVKKKGSDGSEQRFAMKAIKKSHIISCCSASYTVCEKEALVLASDHPFITTLHWCFRRPATSWGVHYTTSCNTQSSALKMGKIISQNMLSWLELLISRYCCI